MIGTLLLNRYELLEKIGEGGMGIVYKGKCHLLNRFVAIKILKKELNHCEEFITRFKREANFIARLSHSNIVNIYDVGSENNINFIVMEYIDGKTLKQIIKENIRLSYFKALNISFHIAKALEIAHKNNIVHRDIKPDNILVTKDNIVKLMDFGIAKIEDSTTITNSNNIIGSVHYLSPEQAKGKFVDYRTDIYSLGILMYEMITGQVPYDGETSVAVAVMHIKEPIIDPKEIIKDLPENINSVILKALEKEPFNRFQSAKELADVLYEIKENPNFELNFNKNLMDSPTVIIKDKTYDSTVVMEKKTIKSTVLNKKTILSIGLVFLAIFISLLGNYISKNSSTNTETTVQEENQKLSTTEKKLVPSLVEKTEDIAVTTIENNEFTLGNITKEYSDIVPKGLIIRQTPIADTLYDKNGKIDLVISEGLKATETTSEKSGNEKSKEKSKKAKNNK